MTDVLSISSVTRPPVEVPSLPVPQHGQKPPGAGQFHACAGFKGLSLDNLLPLDGLQFTFDEKSPLKGRTIRGFTLLGDNDSVDRRIRDLDPGLVRALDGAETLISRTPELFAPKRGTEPLLVFTHAPGGKLNVFVVSTDEKGSLSVWGGFGPRGQPMSPVEAQKALIDAIPTTRGSPGVVPLPPPTGCYAPAVN